MLVLAVVGLPDRAVDAKLSTPQVMDATIVDADVYAAAKFRGPECGGDGGGPCGTGPARDGHRKTPDAAAAPDRTTLTDVPPPPQRDTSPDLSTFQLDMPDVEVAPVAVMPDPAPVGEDSPLMAGATRDGSVLTEQAALSTPSTPSLAPRIDTRAAPKPPAEAKPDDAAAEATAPDNSGDRSGGAGRGGRTPARYDRDHAGCGRGRHPVDTGRRDAPAGGARLRSFPKPKEIKRAVEEAAAAAAAAKVEEDDLTQQPNRPTEATAEPEPTPTGSRLGADFNSSQKRAIGDVIGNEWNVTILKSKPGYENLVVIVRVQLTRDGQMMGQGRNLSSLPTPSG